MGKAEFTWYVLCLALHPDFSLYSLDTEEFNGLFRAFLSEGTENSQQEQRLSLLEPTLSARHSAILWA